MGNWQDNTFSNYQNAIGIDCIAPKKVNRFRIGQYFLSEFDGMDAFIILDFVCEYQ